MLNKRKPPLTFAGKFFWVTFQKGSLQDRVIQPADSQVSASVWQSLIDFQSVLIAEASKGEIQFSRVVASQLEKMVSDLEKKFRHHLLIDYYKVCSQWESTGGDVNWATCVIFFLHLLLGEEQRIIVGVSGSTFVYKSIRGSLTDPHCVARLSTTLLQMVGHALRYVDKNDVHMIPDLDGISDMFFQREKWPKLYTAAPIINLFTRAYYNQYYTLHPEGTYVALSGGMEEVKGITIKTKPALSDRNYHDIIYRVHLSDGDMYSVVPAHLATGMVDSVQELAGMEIPYGYFHLLVAQVYHDLVTTRPIWMSSSAGRAREKESVNSADKDQPTGEIFRYIPRVSVIGRAGNNGIIPMSQPRVSDPHYVSGHARVGNMTEKQRERILEFERETGFHVLKNLPEGKTWVRPHISPAGDSSAVMRLPKFIRAKIQQDLTRSLREA